MTRTLKQQSVAPSNSPDMTIAEVAAFRREGESTVWRKIRTGAYVCNRGKFPGKSRNPSSSEKLALL